MSRTSSLYGLERNVVRADNGDLRVFKASIFVRDQQRSVDFYVEKLGFDVAADVDVDGGGRWVAVAPPNGSTVLALMEPKPDSPEYARIGSETHIAFMSEDIGATYRSWSARGVVFSLVPQAVEWRGVYGKFHDVDGNSFELVSSDDVTREIDEQRHTAMQKLEAERRYAQELAIAKDVQARLFPQTKPVLATLDYAGMCLQARQVGGDYFDYLVLGQNSQGEARLGLVVGDVSGKGIAAALLMANLQANVRSQSAMAMDHPECMLASVNKQFFANSAAGSYATLFFAEYDEGLRVLRYANCGHLPGLLLRADDSLEMLESTTTLLGLFEYWDCSVREVAVRAGDVLLLYTDGVTESFDASGEEFGEERLIAALRRNRGLDSQALLEAVVEDHRTYCAQGGEQYDDITLIVARFCW